MTPLELDDALDAMELAARASGNLDPAPGLITVQSDHWISVLGAVRAKAATLADGLRHREIKIEIAKTNPTVVLTRVDAGDRSAPYRVCCQGPDRMSEAPKPERPSSWIWTSSKPWPASRRPSRKK